MNTPHDSADDDRAGDGTPTDLFDNMSVLMADGTTVAVADLSPDNDPAKALSHLVGLKATDFDQAKRFALMTLTFHSRAIGSSEELRAEYRAACVARKNSEKLMTAKEFDDLVPKVKSVRVMQSDTLTESDARWVLLDGSKDSPPVLTRTITAEDRATYSTITNIVARPFITGGYEKMVAFPLRKHQFNAGEGDTFYDVVCWVKPIHVDTVEDVKAERLTVNAFNGSARIYTFDCKHDKDGSLSHTMIIDHPVIVEEIGELYTVNPDRSLKAVPNTLGIRVRNKRDIGDRVTEVHSQDLFKTVGQATWHNDTWLNVEVPPALLTRMARYLGIGAKHCSSLVSRVKGLGPVWRQEYPDNILFVSAGGTFDVNTGESVSGYRVNDTVKKYSQFGVTTPVVYPDMKKAYETLAEILNTCPSHPGIPAAQLGVVSLAALSTLNKEYRTVVYTYGDPGSGKTQLSKTLLAMQSPTARGYAGTEVTATMRSGRGGTTSNGVMMDLQTVGGFASVLDDFIQKTASTEDDRKNRESGLSLIVGGLEGTAPSKQTWKKNVGPESAETFQAQASILINGELSVTEDIGILRRIIEMEGPTQKFEDAGGYDHKLFVKLLSVESGDAIHAAYSDLVIWSFRQRDMIAKLFADTLEELSEEWNGTTDPSQRRQYAVAVTGLRVIAKRAIEHGVDLSQAVEVATKALRVACESQYGKVTVEPQDDLTTVLRLIRLALSDTKSRASIAGPPVYSVTGEEVTPYTDPFSTEVVHDRGDDKAATMGPEDDEELTIDPLPDWITSRTELGLTLGHGGSGWTIRGQVGAMIGSLIKRKPEGKGFAWRIQVTNPQMDELISQINEQLFKAKDARRFTKAQVRELLLGDNSIATKGKTGPPPKADRYNVININAEKVFTLTEDGDDS